MSALKTMNETRPVGTKIKLFFVCAAIILGGQLLSGMLFALVYGWLKR